MRKPVYIGWAMAGLLTFGINASAFAHVKWFTAYSYAIRPLTLPEVLTPMFWAFLGICVVAMSAMVVLDQRLTTLAWYERLSNRLVQYAGNSDLIIRISVGAVLLFCWQAGKLLVPELPTPNAWIELAQLVLAGLILANRYLVVAGLGLLGLYLIALFQLGWLHVLDYSYFLGACYYILVSTSARRRIKDTRLPILYASVGFSLCWAALEKLVYPGWALSIFSEHPELMMNMDAGLFLLSSAFVEFACGFLLLVCLMQRVMALLITGLFVSTTLIFGKVEFVGHAVVHAALIVFIIKGASQRYRTPVTFFYRMNQRVIFAIVSFTMVMLLMLASYCSFSMNRFEAITSAEGYGTVPLVVETKDAPAIPEVYLDVQSDAMGGWNLHLQTLNFTFAPESHSRPHVLGEGHAHLFINDEKAARIYSNWHHLPALPPGTYELSVTLNANNHAAYVCEGVPIVAKTTLVVE